MASIDWRRGRGFRRRQLGQANERPGAHSGVSSAHGKRAHAPARRFQKGGPSVTLRVRAASGFHWPPRSTEPGAPEPHGPEPRSQTACERLHTELLCFPFAIFHSTTTATMADSGSTCTSGGRVWPSLLPCLHELVALLSQPTARCPPRLCRGSMRRRPCGACHTGEANATAHRAPPIEPGHPQCSDAFMWVVGEWTALASMSPR
jgi:hypothetical protein